MAYGETMDQGEDVYGGDGQGAAPDDMPKDEQNQVEGHEGETTLVPESICPGMKAGDEMVLKIESIQDGQYVVSYSPGKDKSGHEETSEMDGDDEDGHDSEHGEDVY